MSSRGAPLRGQVYFVEVPRIGAKPCVVVSNDRRNRAYREVIVARITTAPKPDVPSIVSLPHGEVVAGSVLCDDLSAVPKGALGRQAGGLSQRTMERVNRGLKEALGIVDE
jgi:mRNA interferase MazF